MPRKPKKSPPEAMAPVAPEILDQFVGEGPLTAAEVETASRRFKKALIERALGAELSHHLGYPPGAAKRTATTNHRNGTSGKTVLTDDGPVAIEVPRDREGTFEPQLIGKHERRFTGFDDKVIALYARGLTVREIQAFLAEMSAIDVSPELISQVTDAVTDEITAWQSRPLEPLYPVVFFDALRVKMRDEGLVRNKAVYPATTLQTCLVHLLRHSLDYATWKERKTLAAALRPIYTAPSVEAADAALDAFAASRWGERFAPVVASWRRAWPQVIAFFAFPPEVRRVIYTTNALESVHARLRKILKTRGHFPTDEAATKLLWLALRNITREWARPVYHWRAAMTQFAILYEDRFTRHV